MRREAIVDLLDRYPQLLQTSDVICFGLLLKRTALARIWRHFGREWAVAGEVERSKRCHDLADWWELPLLVQIFTTKPPLPQMESK